MELNRIQINVSIAKDGERGPGQEKFTILGKKCGVRNTRDTKKLSQSTLNADIVVCVLNTHTQNHTPVAKSPGGEQQQEISPRATLP